jgi:hypothetical protein
MDAQMAASISKAVTDALQEHAFSYIDGTLVTKINEIINGYNQLRLDLTAAMIPVTALPITTLPT